MDKSREIILVGDKVLIKPSAGDGKTSGGLYLPPNVKEKEKVQTGYIIRTGPGYALPDRGDENFEPWEKSFNEPHYLPLQADEGDFAIYLKKAGIEIELDEKKYVIVPHSAILVLMRDDFSEKTEQI